MRLDLVSISCDLLLAFIFRVRATSVCGAVKSGDGDGDGGGGHVMRRFYALSKLFVAFSEPELLLSPPPLLLHMYECVCVCVYV